MKTKKIIKVLNFIQDYCSKRDCTRCQFADSRGGCNFTNRTSTLPEEWNIYHIEKNLKDVERIKIND
jgi:hypothetical protein